MGAGTALHTAISAWVGERRLGTIETVVADNDPESLAFAQRRGFVEDRREYGVSLDLTRIEPPTVKLPEGVEIVTWAERPELAHAMYEVVLEAAPDIPGGEGEQIEPYEDWLAHDMLSGPGDRPDATFVAVAGDEVVGYAKFSLTAAQPTTAHHDLTGVKRAWRRPRGRSCAQGHADHVGEGEWLRGAAHSQRRAEHTDPPPQRGVRLPADGRQDLPEGSAGVSHAWATGAWGSQVT